MTTLELANKYKELARENVNVKQVFPPNRYLFTEEYFRPISGWDKEWYDTMYGWMEILESEGWKVSYYDRDCGESLLRNFEYLYDEKLPSCSAFESNNLNFSLLRGDKCSQLAVIKEKEYSLFGPPSFNPFYTHDQR